MTINRDGHLPDGRLPTTRRKLLRNAGASMLVVASAPLLEACGGSNDSSSTTDAAKASTGGINADVVSGLRKALSLPTGKAAGEGLTIPVGASLAFSGASSILGKLDNAGIKLAVAHIAALGGPMLKVDARDNGLVDAAKGVANARQWGTSGIPVVLTSGAATVFSELPYYPQYKMVGFEPGGATKLNEGKPFYYQTRSEFPDDMLAGIVKYVQAVHPEWKKVSYCAIDYGAAVNDSQEAAVKKAVSGAGWEYLGRILASPTSTSYSATISSLRKAKPDFILCLFTGGLTGIFMKQYATSGLTAQVIGFDFTPDAAKIAGPAVGKYDFSFDYFDAANPPNDWAKIFVSEFKRSNGGQAPTYYSANYYESTFLIWQLIREIVAKGGDPTKQGTAYTEAISATPTFASVYGSGTGHGTKQLDPKTHSLLHAPMVYANAADGTPKVLATFDRTGSGFKLI